MATPIPEVKCLLHEARKAFVDEFGEEPEVAVAAPGRVNIIGEYTDYNDGYVLPMALPLVTIIVGRKIIGPKSTIITLNTDVEGPRNVDIERPVKSGQPTWANYVRGVVAEYLGLPVHFQAVVVSSVPTGSGLSSSAALEVATYLLLDALTGPSSIMPTDKALACQKAEQNYAGVPCGIMDQFISMLGQKDHMLLIDCRTLTSTLVPFNPDDIVILITNTNVKHELNGSEYSIRQKQCHEAALLLDKLSLRDATLADIQHLKKLTTDGDIIKRARHAVTEIQRTYEAAEALKSMNYNRLGALMTESHLSLKNDFEVSCSELDTLVDAALEIKGVLGSRMTGGGFGGCTVTLVYERAVDNVMKNMKNKYKGTPTFYVCKPCDGARVIHDL